MRILAAGDHHFHEHTRFEECVRVHQWLVDIARHENIDLFLSGGDVFEKISAPVERHAVADWLVPTAEICPVLIARGNHDRAGDAEFMSRLESRHPIIVETAASVHWVSGAGVAAFAWPDRASIAASVPESMQSHPEAIDSVAADAFRTVLLGLGQQLDLRPELPRILLGHAMIDGSIASTGQPLLGLPLRLGLADLALARPHLGLFSHIHKSQSFTFGGVEYGYMGSLFRTDFGQLEEKSVVIAEFDGPRLVKVERIPTPCTRMIHIDEEWGAVDAGSCPGGWMIGDGNPDEFSGAEIRFRYLVANDERNAAKQAADQMKRRLLEEHRAASVKIEEVVIPTTRARAPEIAAATSLAEKACALWTSRGEALPEPRRERLLGKLAQLEQETSDAA